jgi:AraC-like DNA-binding protein
VALGLSGMINHPLNAYPLIRTRSIGTLEAAVEQTYGSVKLNVNRRSKDFDVIANHCQLQNVGITYAHHGAPIDIKFPNFETFAQLFSLGGRAEVTQGRGGVSVGQDSTCIVSPGGPLRLRYSGDFKQLALKVSAASLLTKLEALIGEPARGQLFFRQESRFELPNSDNFRRMVLFLLDRLDAGPSEFHPLALAEFEQALMVSYLTSNYNNHSHLLSRNPSLLAPAQIGKVEEYIEANWDQPISIEALSIIAGVSVRSIFHHFRKNRGYSPMQFVKLVRLQHAHQALSKPTQSTSVTDVAIACGFGNLGHFSSYYYRQYRESPSETLRRSRKR